MSLLWSPVHATLCSAALLASALTRDPRILALVGLISLTSFALSEKPRSNHLGGFGVANTVTAARLWILAAGTWLVPEGWPQALVGVVVLIIDGLDGALARRLGEVSEFGARFDMETDALFVSVLCVQSLVRGAPIWVLGFGLIRYLLVLVRLAFPGKPQERRSRWGRYVFVVVVASLLLSLLPIPAVVSWSVLALAGAALLASFSQDFMVLKRT